MDSTLRLLIVALAMLGAFLIGASSGAGRWVPVGTAGESPLVFSSVVNSDTGKVCTFWVNADQSLNRACRGPE